MQKATIRTIAIAIMLGLLGSAYAACYNTQSVLCASHGSTVASNVTTGGCPTQTNARADGDWFVIQTLSDSASSGMTNFSSNSDYLCVGNAKIYNNCTFIDDSYTNYEGQITMRKDTLFGVSCP